MSRAFTEGASISPETRAKVLAAANALGYRPNLIARSLITRRSGIVGVVAGYLENQFYPAVLRALSERLAGAGYRILLFTPERGEDHDPHLEEVLRYRVDGLVMLSAALSSRFAKECRQAGLPVVLLNRVSGGADASTVTGNNIDGARLIARFLKEGGHLRYAYVSGWRDSSTNRDREAGYRTQLQSFGLAPPQVVEGNYDFDQAKRAARELFSAPERPDAVFCANDHMALAVLESARLDFGLVPGRDVSIVGFDDAPPARWATFALTSYSQPIAPMAEAVLEIIRAAGANQEAAPIHRVVLGELVVRASARLPASGVRMNQDGLHIWAPAD